MRRDKALHLKHTDRVCFCMFSSCWGNCLRNICVWFVLSKVLRETGTCTQDWPWAFEKNNLYIMWVWAYQCMCMS